MCMILARAKIKSAAALIKFYGRWWRYEIHSYFYQMRDIKLKFGTTLEVMTNKEEIIGALKCFWNCSRGGNVNILYLSWKKIEKIHNVKCLLNNKKCICYIISKVHARRRLHKDFFFGGLRGAVFIRYSHMSRLIPPLQVFIFVSSTV